MKNPYKKYIKMLSKSDIIIAEYHEDDRLVYIANPYMILRVPMPDYNLFFRTEKPCYIELQDGFGYHCSATDLPKAEPQDTLYKMWKHSENELCEDVHLTNIYAKPDERLLRFALIGDKDFTLFNTIFLDSIPYLNDNFRGSKKHAPIMNEECMILPVRFDSDEDLRKLSRLFM